jgi:hypothetical protein
MEKLFLSFCVLVTILVAVAAAQEKFETDTFKTSAGDLKIAFFHKSLPPIPGLGKERDVV